jgi:regulatory protein
LARREYSRAELARRLAVRPIGSDAAVPPEEIAGVLDQLEQRGMLSDERYAAARTRVRGQRYGAARVKQELKQQGLADDLVEAAVAKLKSTELERARAIWRKRFGAAPTSANERARQMRFLAQRGFATAVIRQVVGGRDDETA